jgi:hypothetical protein
MFFGNGQSDIIDMLFDMAGGGGGQTLLRPSASEGKRRTTDNGRDMKRTEAKMQRSFSPNRKDHQGKDNKKGYIALLSRARYRISNEGAILCIK